MTTTDEQAIRQVLDTYRKALNTSDADLAASVYATDGVFMPDHIKTSSGTEIRGAYVQIFDTIKLAVEFHYDEISVHGDLAVARTHSEGKLTVLADDAVVEDEQNRELFVLARRDGAWKIASYMFNKPF